MDRRNHHLFQPMLYQVATAGLNPSDIASPIRSILRASKNTEVLLAEVRDVDVDARTVRFTDGATASYDYLVVATGAHHSYFGHDEWEPLAPGLKSLEDALEIRRRVLLAFERAERETDPVRRHAYLTFVIVGGGPTGVEMAGAVAEIRRYALRRDFRHIDPGEATVMLLEGGPRLLPSYPESLSDPGQAEAAAPGRRGAHRDAGDRHPAGIGQRRGVGHPHADGHLGRRQHREPHAPEPRRPARSRGPRHRRARLHHPGPPGGVRPGRRRGVRPSGGRHAAGHLPGRDPDGRIHRAVIEGDLAGRPRRAFSYWDKGQLAVIGRGQAVADIWKLHFGGFLAWLVWIFVHIFFLIGFRNRVLVLLQWAWSYFTYSRGARLITGEVQTPRATLEPAEWPARTA